MIFENHPDTMPTQQMWQYRRDLFAYYVGQALGDEYIGVSTDQTRILELELERVFCSGVWVVCIILACASGEVYLHAKGAKREAKFLKQYKLRTAWMSLETLRNKIVYKSETLSYQDP